MTTKNPAAVALGSIHSPRKAQTSAENGKKGGRPRKRHGESWGAWYRAAREDMAFRYGIRRIRVDDYKVEHSLGRTPIEAAKSIYEQLHARGDRRVRS